MLQFSVELPPLHVQCTGHMTPCFTGTVFSVIIETPGVMLVCWYCTCTWQIQSVLDTVQLCVQRCGDLYITIRLHWGEQLSWGAHKCEVWRERAVFLPRVWRPQTSCQYTGTESYKEHYHSESSASQSHSVQCSVIPHSERRKQVV